MNRLSILFLAIISISILTSCGSNSTSSKTTYQVSINAVPNDGGTVSPTGGEYEEGKKLDISATPADSSWQFDKWSGDYQGTNSSASITVNKAKNIKANFSKKKYQLSVNTEGHGTVDQKVLETSSANGYKAGMVIQLTAKPDSGWKFVKFKGDISTSDNPAQITVKEPNEVTAVFEKNSFAVTVNVEGEGSVSISPDQDEYTFGTEIELTANADQNWEFSEWSGDISETDNPLTLTVNGAMTITAIFSNTTFAGGSGTEAKPYKISTLEQLQSINDYPEAHFVQINDIDASATSNWNNGKGFRPIGDEIVKFSGSYDGGSFKISNLFINRTSKDNVGLFGYLQESEISNINLNNVEVSGDDNVGAVIGYAFANNKIEKLSVSGEISGSNNVGGIIGYNRNELKTLSSNVKVNGNYRVGGIVGKNEFGSISNAESNSTVSGYSSVGGLVGSMAFNSITDSQTAGKVIGSSDGVGGIAGNAASTVSGGDPVDFSNLQSSCHVIGGSKVGGIFGRIQGNLYNSKSTGNIEASGQVGGIAGYFSYGEMVNAHAKGNVKGNREVGGLVGSINGASISQSMASGDVTGVLEVGGLVGWNRVARITKSLSIGYVEGNEKVGGLVGLNTNSGGDNYGIYNSYSKSQVVASVSVGGLVGANEGSSKVINSYSIGKVKGSTDVGGLIGTNGATVKNSYWDTQSTNENDGVGRGSSDGTMGLTTDQMIGTAAENNMVGLDFTEIWTTTDSYPVLSWE